MPFFEYTCSCGVTGGWVVSTWIKCFVVRFAIKCRELYKHNTGNVGFVGWRDEKRHGSDSRTRLCVWNKTMEGDCSMLEICDLFLTCAQPD